jgi:hypothetical protein
VTTDVRDTSADLALLHALVGHYARMLWDVQEARVAMANRIAAMRRDGVPEQWHEPLAVVVRDLEAAERAVNRQLARLSRRHFLSGWIEATPGIGLPGFGRLIAVTGALDRFATTSKLWAYLGMHVQDGMAPRRRRGQRSAWSVQGRVVCHQLARSIVRARRSRYREAYDRKKAEYLARDRRGPSACPFGQTHRDHAGNVLQCDRRHAHAAAMRYAVKRLLRDLWVEWRHAAPLRTRPENPSESRPRTV